MDNTMWYDSNTFAVVVGAVLGFLLSYIPNIIERYRQRRALRRVLFIEVRLVIDYLSTRHETYLRYLNMVSDGGQLGVYTTDRSLDVVYRANVGEITSLGSKVAKNLVEFYDGVNEFSGRIQALSESLQRYHTRSDTNLDQIFFIKSLEKIVAVIDRTVECGNNLLATEQPNKAN